MFETGPGFAASLDAGDPLAGFRTEFHHPRAEDGSPLTYFVGNSLGLQPIRAATVVNEELAKWAEIGVGGHFDEERPWMAYHELFGGPMARLVGASEDEVVTMNSLTANLHLMMISFYEPLGTRTKVLIESHAFPSDHFAVESQIRQRGLDPAEHMVQLSPRVGEETLRTTDILDAIDDLDDSLALVMLPGVQYYTGQVIDMAATTEAAHRVGAMAGFNLAHAVGNIPMALHDWNVDFAVWCTYKYLNAGPGSVGGAFVHERHHTRDDLERFNGWWGHDKQSRFEMNNHFVPIPTVEAWQVSNAPIMSMAPLVASLELFERAGIQALRSKAEKMVEYLDFRIVASDHEGHAVFDELAAAHIECDWRYPDVIRLAPVPLYNTFGEIHRFVATLADILS